MSSNDATRSSLARVYRPTRWAAVILSVALIPHAVLSTLYKGTWPDSLVTIHVGLAGVSTVVVAVFYSARWVAQRTAEHHQKAYDAGRAESMAGPLAELEQRIRQ